MTRFLHSVLLACLALSVSGADSKPIRALMVTGGCCHDYEHQKAILSEGISARANVVWTIVHEGDDRTHEVSIYSNPNWADGYDVVLHNECFGYVTNVALVERIAAAHYKGVPAVMLHCSTHSYRMAATDAWRECLGQRSMSHETGRDFIVTNQLPGHPIMMGFPKTWLAAKEELYKNEKLFPNFIPLADAWGVETKKTHAVIWVNTYGQARVFGTTLGHGNNGMSDPVYLDLVTRGLLWACDKLDDKGKPMAGYEAKAH
jgi:type 1 glutamine amidotransferase